jgi:LysR family transcriptional regulator, glycine cleavage system transcriptional activator
MSRPSPPLQSLRCLEAAARRHSFSRAAEELHLTHGAVSHHLRALESQLSVQLFTRSGNSMIPTAVGAQLAERVRRLLGELELALEAARPGETKVARLEVSIMTELAFTWLIPRLSSFYDSHPDIDLSIHTHTELLPPDPYPFDVGIWHRRVEEPGFLIRKLLDDQVVAVCSPELLKKYPDFKLEDILGMPLLLYSKRRWKDFFLAAGIQADEPDRGPMFDDPSSLLQAALAGQGVATLREQLVRDYLRRGQLIQLGNIRMPALNDYFFTWREEHPRKAAIQKFYNWIKLQLR